MVLLGSWRFFLKRFLHIPPGVLLTIALPSYNTPTPTGCLGAVQQWADETSAYLKLIDPNHLIGFGQEGFFGRSSDLQSYNPSGVPGNVQAGWSAWVGQDFESQHSPANIDFLSFHMWMGMWLWWLRVGMC